MKLTRIPKWLHPKLKQMSNILEIDFTWTFAYIDDCHNTNALEIVLLNKNKLYIDLHTFQYIDVDLNLTCSAFSDDIQGIRSLSYCFKVTIIKSSADVYYIADLLYYFLDSPLDIIRVICGYLYNYAITNAYDGDIIYSSYKILEKNKSRHVFLENKKNEIKLWEL